MTLEEYFEGLGCSPDEAQVCVAASRYRRELKKAAEMIDNGCILVGDPDECERRRRGHEEGALR